MSAREQPLLSSHGGNAGTTLDHNLWIGPGRFSWNDQEFGSFWRYRLVTGQDTASVFADPRFVNGRGGDFHLLPASPAVNLGTTTPPRFAPQDFEGRPRPQGSAPDAGAFEVA